mgnify:FL=1
MKNLGHIDFIAERAGKGNAVAFILDKQNVSVARVFGLGDDWNDLSLLERATDAFVPGSAFPKVIRCAKEAGYRISEAGYFDGINEILDEIAMALGFISRRS